MGFMAGALRAPTHPEPSREEGAALGAQKAGDGEDFQTLQLLVPRRCSAACPRPLFYLQMPFYLCSYCCSGKIPFPGDRREGSAASCAACTFPRPPAEQKHLRWHKTLPPPPCSKPRLPWGCWRQLCRRGDCLGTFWALSWWRKEAREAELVRKALKRLHPNPVGWRLAGRRGQSKQEAAACREVPAARLPYPSGGSGSCWRQQGGLLPSQT